MLCPECGLDSKVYDSRSRRRSVWRRRECLTCKYRWSTFEVIYVEGMDPYPMCIEDGCHQPKHENPIHKYGRCRKHQRRHQNKLRSTESRLGKRRQTDKLGRMRRDKA